MMKNMIMECNRCDGDGWNYCNNRITEELEITDCPKCKGKGGINIKIADNRKINKKRITKDSLPGWF